MANINELNHGQLIIILSLPSHRLQLYELENRATITTTFSMAFFLYTRLRLVFACILSVIKISSPPIEIWEAWLRQVPIKSSIVVKWLRILLLLCIVVTKVMVRLLWRQHPSVVSIGSCNLQSLYFVLQCLVQS